MGEYLPSPDGELSSALQRSYLQRYGGAGKMLHIENLTPTSFRENGQVPLTKPRRQVRNRKKLSCLECRRRKLKCDRKSPCSRCARADRGQGCVYETEASLESVKNPGGYQNSDQGSECSLPSGEDDAPSADHNAAMSDEGDQGSDKGTKAKGAYSTSTYDLALNTRDAPRDASTLPPSNPAGGHTPGGRPVTGHYRKGKVRVKGHAHWSYLGNEFGELVPFLFGAAVPGFENTAARLKRAKVLYKPRMQRNRNYPFGSTNFLSLPPKDSTLSILPPRDVVEAFVNNYLHTFETTHRLLHIPTFNDEMRQFWENPGSVSNAWLAQLLMMLALGCPRGQREKDIGAVDTFLDLAEAYLNSTPFMYKPNLEILRTMCMMVLAKQIDIVAFDDSDAVWSFLGLIVRLAISIGLHMDPSHFDDMPILEREMRKRIWTTIVFMDLQNSIESSMPITLKSYDFDCPPPANFNDCDLSDLAGHVHPHSDDIFTDSSYQILQAKSFGISLQVMDLVDRISTVNDTKALFELDAKVRNLLKETSQVFNIAQNSSLQDAERTRTIILQKTITEMYLRRLLLELYRPQSQVWLSAQSQLFYSSLECSFAMIVLQRTFYEGDDDTSIEWFAELFKGDFFVAAVYVCLGLWRDNLGEQNGGHLQLLERHTAILALEACLEIMGKKIALSVDHLKTHMGLSAMIHGLEAKSSGTPVLVAMEKAAECTFLALERAFPGKVLGKDNMTDVSGARNQHESMDTSHSPSVAMAENSQSISPNTSISDQGIYNFVTDDTWLIDSNFVPAEISRADKSDNV